jgi:LmbE family N-acetylglucosaminyl deacetylase
MVKFLGKKLLFVVAHPDDESFTAAGLIHLNRKLGGKNYILCATLGERGKSHLKTGATTTAQLKKIRKKEIQKAAGFLKVDGLFFDRLPDTKVGRYKKRLQAKISGLIKRLRPDYIFSFGSDGISGHLDHIAAGQTARIAAKKAGLPFVSFAASPIIRAKFSQIKARRKHGKYADKIKHKLPNFVLKVDGKIKRKTLAFHKSQAGSGTLSANFSRQIRNSFLNHEYFLI